MDFQGFVLVKLAIVRIHCSLVCCTRICLFCEAYKYVVVTFHFSIIVSILAHPSKLFIVVFILQPSYFCCCCCGCQLVIKHVTNPVLVLAPRNVLSVPTATGGKKRRGRRRRERRRERKRKRKKWRNRVLVRIRIRQEDVDCLWSYQLVQILMNAGRTLHCVLVGHTVIIHLVATCAEVNIK